jgi:transcriptional regulator with XRE-family HTH domain
MEQSMKIDGNKVRTLRESRAWSQEQLATASGLSVRTVQRAEVESSASRETRVCLAAAFGIDHNELNPTTEPAGQPATVDETDLVLRATGSAFLLAGACMIALLALLGEWGLGNPVFSVGFFSTVSGIALLWARFARKRQKGQAGQVA